MFWIYLCLCLIFDITGLSLAKKYVLTGDKLFLGVTLFCFLLVGWFFIQMMRYEGMGIANVIWAVFSLIASVAIGFLIFQEKITSLQFVGIILCLVGIIIIQWPTK